eukprot:10936673-Alexandrium_andersonii.AAC.1
MVDPHRRPAGSRALRSARRRRPWRWLLHAMPGVPPDRARHRPAASQAPAKWRRGRQGTRYLRPKACQR